jgi:hypothetical protein
LLREGGGVSEQSVNLFDPREQVTGEVGTIPIRTGRALFRNHVTQKVRFFCKRDVEIEKANLERLAKLNGEVENKRLELQSRKNELAKIEQQIKRKKATLVNLAQGIREKEVALAVIEREYLQRPARSVSSFWPSVPEENKAPVEQDGKNLPASSGIYFLWEGQTCVYVGQSVNLQNRVRLSHDKARLIQTPRFTFLEFAAADLLYAECFYISLLKPSLNRNCYASPAEKLGEN